MQLSRTSLPLLALAVTLLGHPIFGQSATPAVISQLTVQVQSGFAPISGAKVQLYQADLTSNTPTSTPLLPFPALTNGNGVYTLSGVTCTPGALYYLAATGGDTGSGTNPAIAMMTAVGSCAALSSASTIVLNEVTTVSSVYSLSGFMTAITTVGAKATPPANGSANDTLLANNALSGITNAFTTTNNLVDITSGIARTATPAGNGTVPQAEIDTLANALAACVESSGIGSSGCTTLIANTPSRSGAGAVDTVQAALNIAHNPAANVAALYALASAMTPVAPVPCKRPPVCSFAVRQTIQAPYGPVLAAIPNDWTIVIPYTGGAVSNASSMAVDVTGNIWIANSGTSIPTGSAPLTSTVSEFANDGTVLSGAGYKAPSFGSAIGISIDPSGNAWVAAYGSKNLVEFAPDGSVLFNYTNSYLQNLNGLAIDGSGNIWVPLNGSGNSYSSVAKFANSGALLTSIPGYVLTNSYTPYGIAIDQAGSAWIVNFGDSNVSKLDAQGKRLSGTSGFASPSLGLYPSAVAIDASGNAWVESGPPGTGILTEFSSSGTVLSGSTGYPICVSSAAVQCATSFFVNASVAIDGAGNLWAPLSYNAVINGRASSFMTSGVAELSSTGTILSGPSGYSNDTAITIGNVAVDNSGNVWSVSGKNIVREIIGAAVPVVTPLSLGIKTARLGSRP